MKTQSGTGLVELTGESNRHSPRVDQYYWSDFGGYQGVVGVLRKIARTVQSGFPAGEFVPKGILFAGAPGTGKTLLSRVFAQESGLEMIDCSFPAIGSPYVNGTADNLKNKLEGALRGIAEIEEKGLLEIGDVGLAQIPNIGRFFFMEDLEQLASRENAPEDFKAAVVLKMYMDGLSEAKGFIFGGTTNRVNLVDPELIRYDRFGVVVNLGVPDDETIGEIYRVHMGKIEKGSSLRHAFAKGVDISAIVAASSNAEFVAKLLPEQRFLAQTGIFGGSNLPGYVACATAQEKGKVPEIKYEGVVTGAVIHGVLNAVYKARVLEGVRSGHYEPITTQDILGAVAQRRGR